MVESPNFSEEHKYTLWEYNKLNKYKLKSEH